MSVTELAPGRHVVDFGQNSNGWVRLDDLGPAGTELTHRPTASGSTPTATSPRPTSRMAAFAAPRDPPLPFQTDVVISAGDGSAFEPRHTTKGFQYVRIEGHPGPLDPALDHQRRRPHRPRRRSAGSSAPTSASTACTGWPSGASAATPARSPPTAPPASAPGGWATGSSTSAPPPTSTTSPTGRPSGCSTWPPTSCRAGAVTNIVPDPSPDAPDLEQRPRLLGLGRRRGARALGAPPRHAAAPTCWPTSSTRCAAGSTSPPVWPRPGRHPSRVEAPPRAAPARALPLGQRLALRRVARARRSTWRRSSRQLLVDDHGPVATAYLYRSADELARIAGVARRRRGRADHYARAGRQRARRLAHRVHRRRRPRATRDAGQPGARPRLRPRPRRPPRPGRRTTSSR